MSRQVAASCRVPIALVACAVLGGCASWQTKGLPADVQAVPGWVRTVAVDGSAYQRSTGSGDASLRLQGAINEIIGCQLRVRARGSVDVSVGPFRGAGRELAGNVALYRINPVEVNDWPGWHVRTVPPSGRIPERLDVLVPVEAPQGGLPTVVLPDEALPLWIDVRIPKGTAPGTYRAELIVTVNGVPAPATPIELLVHPFILPDRSGPPMIADLDHRALFAHHVKLQGKAHDPSRIAAASPVRDRLEGTLTSAMRLLHDHRLTPQLPRLYPVAKVGSERNLSIDWSDYDRTVAPFLDGTGYADRLPERRWALPLDETFPEPPSYGPLSSPTYANIVGQYVRAAASHFADRGWLNRVYVTVPFAHRMDADARELTQSYSYMFRRADRRVPIVSALFPQDMVGYGWHEYRHEPIDSLADIWAPAAQFLETSTPNAWLVADRPPYSASIAVMAPPANARALAWQGASIRADATYLGAINNWPDRRHGRARPQACVDHDPHVLIYPGAPFGLTEPVPSLRLKQLRRGMQDVALVELLRSRGREFVADTVQSALVTRVGAATYGAHFADGRQGGTAEDPEVWTIARNILLDELAGIAAATGQQGKSTAPSTRSWRRFAERTQRLVAVPGGVRIRPSGPRPGDGMDIECFITLRNDLPATVNGTVQFVDLPLGWVARPERRPVSRLSSGTRQTVVLTAWADTLTWNENGVRYLPVKFESTDGLEQTWQIRLSHVTAHRMQGTIDIDGDLRDWAAGVGNYASDFLLITGPSVEQPDRTEDRPAQQTLCFVGRTADAVCFAVRCAIKPGSRRDLLTTGTTSLDDLVPVGTEAVEILLDPANAGTRSTGDLYRLVIRPGGIDWHRGVPTDPPTGAFAPWPANIRHAVKVGRDHWSAEVQIPLDALPEQSRESTVWGMNLTRYDSVGAVYSTWSGAVGNAYDPRSLGNVTVP